MIYDKIGWKISEQLKNRIKQSKHILPSNFNYKIYLSLNPDLCNIGVKDEESCIEHYILYGIKEQRKYKVDIYFDNTENIEQLPNTIAQYTNQNNQSEIISLESKIPVLIIQNTSYHFETLISLYGLLKKLNYDPSIYRCVDNTYNQYEFLKFYNMNIANIDSIFDAKVAFVISAYPNPTVSKSESLPNHNNNVIKYFKEKNKIIYISHRFSSPKDYINHYINFDNTVCLSKFGSNIGLDYINLIDSPVSPTHNSYYGDIYLTTQSHFEFGNRNLDIFSYFTNNNRSFKFNLIGTNADKVSIKIDEKLVSRYTNLNELDFYFYLNNHSHWLLPLLSPTTKDNIYISTSYSSTFNISIILEKPIICHEIFKDIYEIPGIYYNNNLNKLIYDISTITSEDYKSLVESFYPLKQKLNNHNYAIINKKLSYVGAI